MSPTAENRYKALDLGLAKAIANHVDATGPIQIDEQGFFAKYVIMLDPWTMGKILPALLEAELRAFSSDHRCPRIHWATAVLFDLPRRAHGYRKRYFIQWRQF